MTTDLTEEEMRQALFGPALTLPQTPVTRKTATPSVTVATPNSVSSKRKVSKAFVPRLKVTLRVGNVFEGETEVMTYEADTLSTLQAELDAKKIARKKFKYIEVMSIMPAK
jgi:hypothetical protein